MGHTGGPLEAVTAVSTVARTPMAAMTTVEAVTTGPRLKRPPRVTQEAPACVSRVTGAKMCRGLLSHTLASPELHAGAS